MPNLPFARDSAAIRINSEGSMIARCVRDSFGCEKPPAGHADAQKAM